MSDDRIRKSSLEKRDPKLRAYHYAALVYGLDRGVGRIMETLHSCGVAENTILIFTSDNGAFYGSNYPLTGHKWDGLEGGIRVPFIVWSHEIAESRFAGTVHDGLVSLVDIAPTLMGRVNGAAGVVPTDGRDIMPFLKGEKQAPQGRRYLITNACYVYQNTGVAEFGMEMPRSQKLMQYVLVKDDEKIICWNPSGTNVVGAVHARFPDGMGQNDPGKVLAEEPPPVGDCAHGGGGEIALSRIPATHQVERGRSASYLEWRFG